MIKNDIFDDGYITVKEKRPCINCGKLTDRVEYNYEAYICSRKCEDIITNKLVEHFLEHSSNGVENK